MSGRSGPAECVVDNDGLVGGAGLAPGLGVWHRGAPIVTRQTNTVIATIRRVVRCLLDGGRGLTWEWQEEAWVDMWGDSFSWPVFGLSFWVDPTLCIQVGTG